jgi:formylglycine-generating enzyme required for sulfatase activity
MAHCPLFRVAALFLPLMIRACGAFAQEQPRAPEQPSARARFLIESLLKDRERLIAGAVQVHGSRARSREDRAPEDLGRGSYTFDYSQRLLRFDSSRRMKMRFVSGGGPGPTEDDVDVTLRYVTNQNYALNWQIHRGSRISIEDSFVLLPPNGRNGNATGNHSMLDFRACGLMNFRDVLTGREGIVSRRCDELLKAPVVEVIEKDGMASIVLGKYRERRLTIDTRRHFCPVEYVEKITKEMPGTNIDLVETTRVTWTEINGIMVPKSFSMESDMDAPDGKSYCRCRFLCLWKNVNEPVDAHAFDYESFTDIPPLTYVVDARGKSAVTSGVWTDEGIVGPEPKPYEGTDETPNAEAQAHDRPPPSMQGERAAQERDDNELKMKFAWCPPGEFTMGSLDGAATLRIEPVEAELTEGFWMGKYEVTQSEWARLKTPALWKGQKNFKEGDDFPATYLSWDNAMAFCAKLTARERNAGRLPRDWEYTLPTDAQWEFACRAGTKTVYSFGDDWTLLPEYGWFQKNTAAVGENYGHPVGQKKPNEFGLYDMHGNVSEWCRDGWQQKRPGGPDPFVAPKDDNRVVRGGCFWHPAVLCQSAYHDAQNALERKLFQGDIGFRVAVCRIKHSE